MNHDLNIVVGVTPQDVTNLDDIVFFVQKRFNEEQARTKRRASVFITYFQTDPL